MSFEIKDYLEKRKKMVDKLTLDTFEPAPQYKKTIEDFVIATAPEKMTMREFRELVSLVEDAYVRASVKWVVESGGEYQGRSEGGGNAPFLMQVKKTTDSTHLYFIHDGWEMPIGYYYEDVSLRNVRPYLDAGEPEISFEEAIDWLEIHNFLEKLLSCMEEKWS